MPSFLGAILLCLALLCLVHYGDAKTRKLFPHDDGEDDQKRSSHSRRSYTMGPGKIMFCRSGAPGPPGQPGSQGMPGRDGRDGRDCPPCNCGGTVSTETPPPLPSPCPSSQPSLVPPQPAAGAPIHGHKRGEPTKKKARNNSLCS